MIKKLFSCIIYIRLQENRVRVTHIDSQTTFDEKPYIAIDSKNPKKVIVSAIGSNAYDLRNATGVEVFNPFSHTRLLVNGFAKAEKIIQHAIREVCKTKLFVSPIVVMHPLEKLEGGITDIELRVYRELAFGAGAREVYIHIGNELLIDAFSLDQINEPEIIDI
jgi:rod shape-determining protein MreB